MGPVRLSDVEAAQQRIVDIVRRLEDAGDIVITGRGGTQDVVV
ncbi:MAG: FliG C-terminal domain-containing protein, partial [Planctomycetota bacterium]|nr:FliG C-terminal domain-containing protein [Planctomycetota bacterium]